jgi:hypothetical protein
MKTKFTFAQWRVHPGHFGPTHRLLNNGRVYATICTGASRRRFCAFMESASSEETQWFEKAKAYCETTLNGLITA